MTVQDSAIREPRVRLRRLLVLARLLAGRRGRSSVVWHGAGFTYELTARRDPGSDPARVEVDADLSDDDELDLGDPAPRVAEVVELLAVLP